MSEALPNSLPPNEITLPDIVREVRRYLFRIVLLTVLVGGGTICYLLMIPNVYESKAALVLRAPEVELTGEAAPLAPEMLVALTESVEVKKTAYDALLVEGVIDENFTFLKYQRALKTEVERRTGVMRDLIPMVQLIAHSKDPELASHMANQWVKAVIERTKAIYMEGVGDLGKFMGDVTQKAEDSLSRAEVKLATSTLKADVGLNKQKLAKQSEQCITFESEILNLTSTLQINKLLIEELKDRVNEQERDGVWIGELMETTYRMGEDIENGSPSSDDIIARIKRRVKDYVDRQKDLKEFKKAKGYDALKLEYDGYTKELSTVLADLASASREIVVAEKRFSVLDLLINQVPQKITLNKAITDNALWQAFLQGGVNIGKATSTLKTEEGNPLYQEVGKLHSAAMVDVQTSIQKLMSYHLRRNELIRLIAELREKQDLIDQQIDAKNEGIAQSKAMLDILRSNYENDRKELSEVRLKVQRDMCLLRIKQDILSVFDRQRQESARSVSENEVLIAGLTREATKMSSIADNLATKAGEIQISMVSAQQASRSGVQVLYQAAPNPQKVGPYRSRILLIAMLMAFLGGIFVVGARLYMGLADTRTSV